jgi:hypothetical protein
MPPDLTLPSSLMALLACFQPCFTAPSFRSFCALAAGFLPDRAADGVRDADRGGPVSGMAA